MTRATKTKLRYAIIGAAVLIGLFVMFQMFGCGLQERQSTLEQKQRETIAEKTTANVVRESLVAPAPMTIETEGRDGSKSTITVPAVANTTTKTQTAATVASDSEAEGKDLQSSKYPQWLGALAWCLVGFLALILLWLWRRSSVAVKAITDKADKAVAAGVDRIEGFGSEVSRVLTSEAASSSDPLFSAKLVALAANLDKSKQDWQKP